MTVLIFFIAILLLFIGLSFIYKPVWLSRINKFVREKIFNDNILLLERRQKGILALLLSFLFFYWGYQESHYSYNKYIGKLVSTDRLLYQTNNHLEAREFQDARVLCEKVLKREPNNPEALYNLAAAHLLLDSHQLGLRIWNQAIEMDPQSYRKNQIVQLIIRLNPKIKISDLQ